MLESSNGRTLLLKDDQHAFLKNHEKMRVEDQGSNMNSASMGSCLAACFTVGRRFRLTTSCTRNMQQLHGGNASSCWRLS
jgi:hypothetical protein